MSRPRKNRNRIEICVDILQIAKDGAMKTRIMYRANLSFEQRERYLSLLQQRDLLKYDPATRIYRTSDKGQRFLKDYNELRRFETIYNEKKTALTDLVS